LASLAGLVCDLGEVRAGERSTSLTADAHNAREAPALRCFGHTAATRAIGRCVRHADRSCRRGLSPSGVGCGVCVDGVHRLCRSPPPMGCVWGCLLLNLLYHRLNGPASHAKASAMTSASTTATNAGLAPSSATRGKTARISCGWHHAGDWGRPYVKALARPREQPPRRSRRRGW
jgi:hypothetical protein